MLSMSAMSCLYLIIMTLLYFTWLSCMSVCFTNSFHSPLSSQIVNSAHCQIGTDTVPKYIRRTYYSSANYWTISVQLVLFFLFGLCALLGLPFSISRLCTVPSAEPVCKPAGTKKCTLEFFFARSMLCLTWLVSLSPTS